MPDSASRNNGTFGRYTGVKELGPGRYRQYFEEIPDLPGQYRRFIHEGLQRLDRVDGSSIMTQPQEDGTFHLSLIVSTNGMTKQGGKLHLRKTAAGVLIALRKLADEVQAMPNTENTTSTDSHQSATPTLRLVRHRPSRRNPQLARTRRG